MNGFDFDARVLQPWVRDPAYYATVWEEQSDTPAHEGPTPHGIVELWTYAFPLSAAEERRLTSELRPIPALLEQARTNLTGNARDLWTTGTETVRAQVRSLADLERTGGANGAGAPRGGCCCPPGYGAAFVVWLDAEAPSKSGTLRHRQGGLQLEPPPRASRADDLGGGGRAPVERELARVARGAEASKRSATAPCRRSSPGHERRRVPAARRLRR
jgi:hypothetical protein